MSGSYRDDRPALLVLGLLVGSIVLISILGLCSRQLVDYPIGQPNTAATEAYQEQRGPSEGYWLPEFATRDTYAQWAMTILAVVATGASLVGIKLLRDTFRETKRTADAAFEANITARQIGEAQVRAYLNCTGGSYSSSNNFLMVKANISNAGQSPSRGCYISAYVYCHIRGASGEYSTPQTMLVQAERYGIPATGSDSLTLFWANSQLPLEIAEHILESGVLFVFECVMTWEDVFEVPQTLTFFLSPEMGSRVESRTNGIRVREGKLTATNRRPQQ